MSQRLPFDETKFNENFCLEEFFNTPDDSDIGYFLQVDLRYSYDKREKQRISFLSLK